MRYVKWILLVAALILVLVFVVLPLVNGNVEAEGASPTVATPSASAAPTSATEMDEHILELSENEDPIDPDLSGEPRPSDELIWQFEQAFYTPDPLEKESLLALVATPQYIEAYRDDEPDRTDGATVEVVPNEVIVTVSKDLLTCVVETTANLRLSRNGEVYLEYLAPTHSTFWINTPEGWRVAQEQ